MTINSNSPLFTNSILLAHCRQVSVFLPCFLIGGSAFAVNERPEFFNGSAVEQESRLDMGVNVRSIMGSVMPGDVNERKSRSERGAKTCCGDTMGLDVGKAQVVGMLSLNEFQGKPVRDECSDKGAKKCSVDFSGKSEGRIWRHVVAFVVGVFGGSFPVLLWMGVRVFRKPNVM